MDFVGAATLLDADDIAAEAQTLGVEAAAIWAVCDVESSGSGFLKDGRPKILFEAHAFHTLTRGAYDRSNPNVSSSVWDRSLYGASGAHQYDRLAEAIELDRTAALESASWGRFQIMGSNFKAAGYGDVESYVTDMMADEANHLKAFGNFCIGNGLVDYLRDHDWTHFALHYNGSGNVADYAGKLARAYLRRADSQDPKIASPPSTALKLGARGPAVLELQYNLIQLSYSINADGDFGPRTDAAVRDFQYGAHLPMDGIAGYTTLAAIQAAL